MQNQTPWPPSYLQWGDRGCVSLQDGQRGAGLQAPHSDSLVTGPGSDHGVLVADGHIRDLSSVAAQCRQQASVICSPDLNKAVVRALEGGKNKKQKAPPIWCEWRLVFYIAWEVAYRPLRHTLSNINWTCQVQKDFSSISEQQIGKPGTQTEDGIKKWQGALDRHLHKCCLYMHANNLINARKGNVRTLQLSC